MKIIYLKEKGFYGFFPVSDEEEEIISEIALTFSPGDRINYCNRHSEKYDQNIFSGYTMYGSYRIHIKFTLSGTTQQDNENIESIVSHAFIPGSYFYLKFIDSMKIYGRFAIFVCPVIKIKKAKAERSSSLELTER